MVLPVVCQILDALRSTCWCAVPEKQRTKLSLASAELGAAGLSSIVDALRPKASGQSASLPADAKLSESSAKPGKIIPAVASEKGTLSQDQVCGCPPCIPTFLTLLESHGVVQPAHWQTSFRFQQTTPKASCSDMALEQVEDLLSKQGIS